MNRPLSILIACFPSLGGSGVVASELAVGLADRGHRVQLVASARPVRTLPASDRLTFQQVAVPGYPVFEHAPYTLAMASRLAELASLEPVDLINVHYAVPHAASALLARQMLGDRALPIVVSLHGTDVTGIGADPAYRPATAFAVGACEGVTVPSEFLRHEARETLGLPASRAIEVIPNFVDTTRFAPADVRDRGVFAPHFDTPVDGPVLFHVSNFRGVKRSGDLLEVLARVRRELPAKLVLVGDGPERPRAEALAHALGLERHVAFLGKREDFVEPLRHADAFVLPSESESFGLAALESLSAGVPVFGYRVGGLTEVVTTDTGRLVDPFDVDALSRAVLEVLRQPERHAELARNARAHAVAHFRREPALDHYESYFRRLIAAGPRQESR